jgi:hypothetical protein
MPDYVLREWFSLPPTFQPEMSWVTMHKHVEADADFVKTRVEQAWFLESGELEVRLLDEYQVFVKVKPDQIWNSGELRPDTAFNNPKHEIAMAKFAPSSEQKCFQVELLWEGWHGRERIIRMTEDSKVEILKRIWIS